MKRNMSSQGRIISITSVLIPKTSSASESLNSSKVQKELCAEEEEIRIICKEKFWNMNGIL